MNCKPLLAAYCYISFILSGYAFALDAPVGLRPCCAFGYDLKAEVANIPIPFFSIGNVVNSNGLGKHVYNDGSQSVPASIIGLGKELNGLIFTRKGGFIDVAHVRDTADFTFYLYHIINEKLATGYRIVLPSELRSRQISLVKNNQLLTSTQHKQISIELAGLLAFRLAQWHEIAQWFGLESVMGFVELPSAFSPEDLYSNMLGAKLAMVLLNKNPYLSKQDFSHQMTQSLQTALKKLGGVSVEETKHQLEALDGIWWDSQQRLPNKWLVLQRDYRLSLRLKPNGVNNGTQLTLSEQLLNGESSDKWAKLYLVADNNQKHFAMLPADFTKKNIWQPSDYNFLANFAKSQDQKERGVPVQVSSN